MNVKRGLTLSLGALCVNLLLFLLMERMAAQPTVQLSAPPSTLSIDFIRLKRTPEEPELKRREPPPEPPPKKPQPPLPKSSVSRPRSLRLNDINIDAPNLEVPMHIVGMPFAGEMGPGGGSMIQEAVPLVRIPPLYPPRALSRKIEGMVKIEFTVDENGHVVDPIVVEADPQGVFDRAALRAIGQWKFERKIVDGQPVPWKSSQTIYFKLRG